MINSFQLHFYYTNKRKTGVWPIFIHGGYDWVGAAFQENKRAKTTLLQNSLIYIL